MTSQPALVAEHPTPSLWPCSGQRGDLLPHAAQESEPLSPQGFFKRSCGARFKHHPKLLGTSLQSSPKVSSCLRASLVLNPEGSTLANFGFVAAELDSKSAMLGKHSSLKKNKCYIHVDMPSGCFNMALENVLDCFSCM